MPHYPTLTTPATTPRFNICLITALFTTLLTHNAISAPLKPPKTNAPTIENPALSRTALPQKNPFPTPPSPTIACNGTDVGPLINSTLKTTHLATLGPGLCLTSTTIAIPPNSTLQGSGLDTTTLQLLPNSNVNLIESANFPTLQASSNALQAPSGINISNLTLNGNYLSHPWKNPAATILNSSGSCIALYASRYTISARVDNCATHLLYSENSGPRPPFEPASVINLYGSTSGQECVVFRGPGDSYIQTLMAGLCGIKPISTQATTPATSTLYPNQPISGLLIDRSPPYDGTVEIGLAHLYGVFDGYAITTIGNPRIKASHLTAESSAGGIFLSSNTWGAISLLDIHNTGITYPQRKNQTEHQQPFSALICPTSNLISIPSAVFRSNPHPSPIQNCPSLQGLWLPPQPSPKPPHIPALLTP